jgi:di/tricarboxylate transporter
VSLAALSLCALILALALSCTTTVNVGFLAVVLAWLVGTYVGGMPVEQIIAGFPSSLFLTLTGLTLLFAQAQVNGTLDRLTHRAVRGAAGAPGVIPFIFFGLTCILASMCPGTSRRRR